METNELADERVWKAEKNCVGSRLLSELKTARGGAQQVRPARDKEVGRKRWKRCSVQISWVAPVEGREIGQQGTGGVTGP